LVLAGFDAGDAWAFTFRLPSEVEAQAGGTPAGVRRQGGRTCTHGFFAPVQQISQ